MLRNIIWDVDGTLFDTYPAMAAAMRAAMADFGVDEPISRLETLARVSVGHCISTLGDAYHLNEEAIERAFLAHYAGTRPDDQPPFPDVRAVCEAVCAAGGKNVIVTHRRRATTLELLAVHDMGRYFSGHITADDGYARKPDPAAFIAALENFDLPAAETMTVGDRDIDILAGRGAGVFTCLFGSAADGVTPDLPIRNFDELHRYLAAQQG
jgi:phosphoglycolate phosphatase-like HAD superfamily hydrolase